MEMNDKRKKQLWIAGIVIAMLYFAPSILSHVIGVFTPSKTSAAVHAKPSAAIPMPVVQAPVTPNPAAQFALLSGKFAGEGMVKERICKMELELNPPDPQGGFAGYTSLSCFSNGSLVGAGPRTATGVVNQFRPASAILTGSVVGSAIKLKANKSIETLSDGCALSGLSIVSFGTGRIAVDWDEDGCPGGQIVLQKR